VFQGVWRKNGKDSGHYHSNWLSMMLPRLHLAKTLLRDDGVIFISIDDNEQAQLKLLCDEVFGAENFVANVIWQKIHSTKNDAKYFSDSHEHITCYAKNILNLTIGLLPRTKEMNARFSNPDSDPRGDWSSGDLVANEERTGGYFNITGPTGKIFNVPQGKHWVYSETNLRRMINENRIWFGKNGDAFPRLKRYLSEVQQGRKVDTLWLSDEVGHNQESKREVKKIFDNQGFFDFPKPVRLIYRNLFIATSKDDLILDFFSGSATTAHAVMQLNAEDGGSRRCISIQLPEATDEQSEAYKAGYLNIAEIAKERIRRAGRQIAAAHPDKNIDTGFKVFKLAESHFKKWQSDVASDGLEAQLNMFIDPVAANALPENIAYELLLRLGLKLTARVWQQNDIFWLEDEGRRTALLLTRVDEALLDELTAQQPDKVVALDRLFDGNDALKTNAVLQMKEADIVFATV
jgi:adenine-specific DNA-methyltransferase